MKTVADLKFSVAGLLTGTNLDNVTNLYGAIERAARVLIQKADIPEASGRTPYMLYNGVYDYPAPAYIFGGSLTDLRPQGSSRTPLDEVYRMPIKEFDQTKCFLPNGAQVTFEYSLGMPVMRVSQTRTVERIVIDPMNAMTGWVAGGSASNLATDTTVYYQQPAALRFNLAAAGGQGYIEKTIGNIDLTSYAGVGVAFIAINLPSTTHITSIGMHLGNDNANYYDVSTTTGFVGAWTAGEYLLIALDLSLATTTGAVDPTKVDYTRIYVNYDGTALTNIRLGAFFISLPSPFELLYQSSAIFLANGIVSNTITTDSDQLLIRDAAYTLLEHEAALTIGLQNGGSLSSGITQTINGVLNGARARNGTVITDGLYDLYRGDNPSNNIREVGSWYDINDRYPR